MSKSHLTFSYPTVIQEIDVDAFGHLNNANYLRLFEQARWDFICRRGYDLTTMRETQQGPVILDVHLRFLKELRPRDSVVITSQAQKYGGKVGQLLQRMLRGDELCAEALFTVGFWDLRTRKLVKATPQWLYAVGVVDQA